MAYRSSSASRYSVTDFPGAVSLKNTIVMPGDGRGYWTIVGRVSILEAAPMVGFEVKDRESNWIARVESPDGKRSINILGCQIQAVMQGDFGEQDGTGVFRL